MADIKAVCPNCNTPRTLTVQKTEGAVTLSCKRCFKRTRILVKDGTAAEAVKAKAEKAAKEDAQEEKQPKEARVKKEKKEVQ